MVAKKKYLLAFDTANEVVAIGIGCLDEQTRSVVLEKTYEIEAKRASNTKLLPAIDEVFSSLGIAKDDLACVAVGRGPGSFTGVRIALATAKGIAQARGVALVGLSTLDSIAWNAYDAGVRGNLLVLADAMRKEVYPVRYYLQADGPKRLEADTVIKAEEEAKRITAAAACAQEPLQVTGDALKKYAALFQPVSSFLPENLWTPKGSGLIRAFEAAWQNEEIDPFDASRHNPAFVLPVYTRLSDAEENERIRLSKNDPKNLRTGVQDAHLRRDQRATMHDTAILNAVPSADGITYRPLDAAHVASVAALESELMGSDAWNETMVADELPRKDRVWWAAYAPSESILHEGELIAYAGGLVVDGDLQILKVATQSSWQRRHIARNLLARVAADARDLGANRASLEVRKSNTGAQAFYTSLGFSPLGTRAHYYSDGEDARIMAGPLPLAPVDVAGMRLQVHRDTFEDTLSASEPKNHPLILAIESSCDETAAALVDASGELLGDVLASQIDFHARFGGVVPEIASRKHIEAICGVCDECFEVARRNTENPNLSWKDLDAIAVTYAPGLVGALVVGVAFGKGAAWALDLPFIGVNHLEGHLYANKIGAPDFKPPAVVSLVSGGNTLLVYMKDWGSYETLGSTIDDAVGEAFDKVAKALGLGYPGGPVISKYAKRGNADAIAFPRAMMHSGDLRFSLSGLKTAVVTYINEQRSLGNELNICDIAASFQQAVVDVQVHKAQMALEQTGARTFCLGGGVAANPVLRAAYEKLCSEMGVRLIMPPLSACTDNAAMIALVALDRYKQKKFFGLDADAYAHASLDDPY